MRHFESKFVSSGKEPPSLFHCILTLECPHFFHTSLFVNLLHKSPGMKMTMWQELYGKRHSLKLELELELKLVGFNDWVSGWRRLQRCRQMRTDTYCRKLANSLALQAWLPAFLASWPCWRLWCTYFTSRKLFHLIGEYMGGEYMKGESLLKLTERPSKYIASTVESRV